MTDETKPVKIIFDPGCFDDFDGTQEELDEMIAEIQRLADSGELFENAIPLEESDLLSEEEKEELNLRMDNFGKRKLH